MEVNSQVMHGYVAISRCRSWAIWPEGERIISNALGYNFGENKEKRFEFSVHLVAYENRPRPENEPSMPCEKYDSPIIWKGKMDNGFWVGNEVLKAPEDSLKVEMVHFKPFQGEVDVQLHVGSESELDIDELKEFFESVTHSVIGYINISLGEYLVPVAPIQLSKINETGRELSNSIKLRCVNRPTLSKQVLDETLSRYIKFRASNSIEKERALDVAMRRYLSSQLEPDVIDRYCDLWEVCEFLTYDTKAKGGKVSKIASALTDYLQKSGIVVKKANLENGLDLKRIYEIRGHIVHNAIDDPDYVGEKLSLLNEIARELIRFSIGESYVGNKEIDEKIA